MHSVYNQSTQKPLRSCISSGFIFYGMSAVLLRQKKTKEVIIKICLQKLLSFTRLTYQFRPLIWWLSLRWPLTVDSKFLFVGQVMFSWRHEICSSFNGRWGWNHRNNHPRAKIEVLLGVTRADISTYCLSGHQRFWGTLQANLLSDTRVSPIEWLNGTEGGEIDIRRFLKLQ